MPEGISAVASYFTADAAAASATAATAGTAETAGVVGATAASGAGAGYATVAGGSTLLGSIGTAVGTALATGAVQSALAPKRPDLPKPIPMPDAQAQEEARKRQIIQATAARGRASTILTDPASGTLGG